MSSNTEEPAEKAEPSVKMEVLEDLFYNWDDVHQATSNFSSLLMNSNVATSKCTVKVPTETEFEPGSAFNLMNTEQPLRVIIPSPLPAGPDTTTTNSPANNGQNEQKTPVQPTDRKSVV